MQQARCEQDGVDAIGVRLVESRIVPGADWCEFFLEDRQALRSASLCQRERRPPSRRQPIVSLRGPCIALSSGDPVVVRIDM